AFGILEEVVVAEAEEIGQRRERWNTEALRYIEHRCGVTDQMADMDDVGLKFTQHALVNMPQHGLLVGVTNTAVRIDVLIDGNDAHILVSVVLDQLGLGRFALQSRCNDDWLMPEPSQPLCELQRVGLGSKKVCREEAMDVEGDSHEPWSTS